MNININKNRQKIITNIIFFAKLTIILTFVFFNNSSLLSVEYSDSRGKDFWLTFIPNYHNNINDLNPEKKYGDSLYIFISAEVPTKGTITYTNRNYQTFTRNFQITDTKQVYIFKVSYWEQELKGFNYNYNIDPKNNYDCEDISPVSFHVESENDITVYAHSQANTTSESFIVLPVDAIGQNYFIMSYRSDGSLDNMGGLAISSTPSQFAIVAIEDSTNVIIKPSCPTRINKQNTQQIILNKGDVYLVQADITASSLYNDLTGTEINSDRKIAVFSGHQRSTLPNNIIRSSSSRDILIEQMPSISSWGKNAFIVPYQQPLDVTNVGTDIYRILAAFDSTYIYVDGVLTTMLNKGAFYENKLLTSHEIKGSRSILVAQFKKTSDKNTGGSYENSDPFMMVIPPKEQFLNFYRFINVQSYEANDNNKYVKVYNYQYVNIISPDSIKNSIRLDGKSLNLNNFQKIGNTNYVFGNFLTSDGVHEIIGNGNFGILVYGYGIANSYGYVGGMSYKPLDFEKPKLAILDTCFSVTGFIHDSLVSDSHLDVVNIKSGTQQNVNVKLYPKEDKPSISRFEARLIDINYDGKFTIEATDSSELYSKFDINIPGFTIAFKNYIGQDSLLYIKKAFRVNKNNKLSLSLFNYGNFSQRIEGLKSINNNIVSTNGFPVVIGKSQNLDFEFTVFSDRDTILYDTLYIWNNCHSKSIIVFEIEFGQDKYKPQVFVVNDPCKTNFDIVITDTLKWDYGIAGINIVKKENCSININEYNFDKSVIKIDIPDPYLDAEFEIEIIDSVGNISSYKEIIPGFTIDFALDKDSLSNSYFDFGENQLGNLLCKSIKLTNYGKYEIIFDNAQLSQNLEFSIPQSQFPLSIKPNETKELFTCFYPIVVTNGFNKDTLKINFKCLSKDILLKGKSDTLELNGKDKCEYKIKLTADKIPFDYYVGSIYPMPVLNQINIEIGLPNESNLNVSLIDNYGTITKVLTSNLKLSAGNYEISYDVSDLFNGMYFVKINFGSETKFSKILIQK